MPYLTAEPLNLMNFRKVWILTAYPLYGLVFFETLSRLWQQAQESLAAASSFKLQIQLASRLNYVLVWIENFAL